VVHGAENRIIVEFKDLPDAMWQAAVAIEDHRFFQHEGVDWLRTLSAVKSFLTGDNTFGASTITQQVLRNITQDKEVTINRKLREIFRALEFEKSVTKQKILEQYLNTIYLGAGCAGVQTAAQYYFGKDVWWRSAPALSPSPTTPPCSAPCPPSPSPGKTAPPGPPGSTTNTARN
jgi:penicillin-binding protein 1A